MGNNRRVLFEFAIYLYDRYKYEICNVLTKINS